MLHLVSKLSPLDLIGDQQKTITPPSYDQSEALDLEEEVDEKKRHSRGRKKNTAPLVTWEQLAIGDRLISLR